MCQTCIDRKTAQWDEDVSLAILGDAAAAARLPMNEWAERNRRLMSPPTIARNHLLHRFDIAHEQHPVDPEPEPEPGTTWQGMLLDDLVHGVRTFDYPTDDLPLSIGERASVGRHDGGPILLWLPVNDLGDSPDPITVEHEQHSPFTLKEATLIVTAIERYLDTHPSLSKNGAHRG